MEKYRPIKVRILSGDEKSQKLVLQSCIPFLALKDGARFYYREPPEVSPYSSEDSNERSEERAYQRPIDEKRIKQIKGYIRNSILAEHQGRKVSAIFPTALLLAFKLEGTDFQRDRDNEVTLPQEFYIVDGQHRLKSMIDLYDDVALLGIANTTEDEIIKKFLDDYIFNCTIMLNFDMWEQAQVFADVNFTQKKVNKSLFYDIYGSNYPDNPSDRRNNSIYIAHNLVRFINEKDESPMKGMVKMLGYGEGLVSQACLVEVLMKHIASPQGIWFIDDAPQNGPQSYKYMAVELISYLVAIKETFPGNWPQEGKHISILCRTTGISALIRLMGYISKNRLKDDVKNSLRHSSEYIDRDYINEVKKILVVIKPYESSLFSKDGDFAGTGGKGLENALYKRLTDIIEEKT